MAVLGLKPLLEVNEGGRVGPCQEDWVHKDDGINQCNDKVRRIGIASGVGSQW